jgi:hypothetical protein
MHGPLNVKSPNNISKWQMGFNSAFKGLKPWVMNSAILESWEDKFFLGVEIDSDE